MMEVRLISYTGAAADIVEFAACKSHASAPTEHHKVMKFCVNSGHDSVIEHASFTFDVTGISRACLAQLTRHRIGCSFTVRSQRYTNEGDFAFYTPPTVRYDNERSKLYAYTMGELRRAYNQLVELGVPKEDARFVLPNACLTELVLTMNARALVHFMNLRLCSRAQAEIRELAARMKAAVVEVAPEFESYLVPNCEARGYCPELRGGCGHLPNYAQTLAEIEHAGYMAGLRWAVHEADDDDDDDEGSASE